MKYQFIHSFIHTRLDDIVLRRKEAVCEIQYGSIQYTSSVTVMQCGVSQGSVLGPLYFVLYTADMFRTVGKVRFLVHGYADDLQIYDHCFASDTPQLTSRLIHCIEIAGRWMSSNRLRLNPSRLDEIKVYIEMK